jgi:pimeloyl-ACP methyl ester carboxylesterase
MSQGGFTALRAALLAPERVRGLVLIDTQAGTEDPELLPLFAALREEWIAHGPAGVRQAAAEMVLGPGVDPTPWFERWDAQDVDELLLVGDALLGREDLSDRLGEIRAPALVVHGDADVAISLDRGRALAQGLGGEAQLVVVPGAGHAANLAQPDLVNRAIVGFLRRLEE